MDASYRQAQATWAGIIFLLCLSTLVAGSPAVIWLWMPVLSSQQWLSTARSRSVGHQLRGSGLQSAWAPACQDQIPGGHAGVGVVSLHGAPPSAPSLVAAEFRELYMFVVHMFVVYGYQEEDSEKLSLAD